MRWLKLAVKEMMEEIPDQYGRRKDLTNQLSLNFTDEYIDASPKKLNQRPQQIEMTPSLHSDSLFSSQLQVFTRNQSVPIKTNQANLGEDIESKNQK